MRDRFGSKALWVLAALAIAMMPALSRGDEGAKDAEKGPVTAGAAFERLKTLDGTWRNRSSEAKGHEHDPSNKVIYHLTGAGSALVETDFPGSSHEMVSVYHLDGDDLRLTHYCAVGNQPRLKLDRAASTPSRLVFVFDGGSNLDPAKDMHIHGMIVTFGKGGEVDSAWEGYAGGKSAGVTHFELSREKS